MLRWQNEDLNQFGHDVFKALALGAKRGVNMAILGGPGMGKSMVFESLDTIFAVPNICVGHDLRAPGSRDWRRTWDRRCLA